MKTLRIEHPITDFDTWSVAFARFAEARRKGGVRAARVQRPIDDACFVSVELDFATTERRLPSWRFSTESSGRTPRTHPRWPARRGRASSRA